MRFDSSDGYFTFHSEDGDNLSDIFRQSFEKALSAAGIVSVKEPAQGTPFIVFTLLSVSDLMINVAVKVYEGDREIFVRSYVAELDTIPWEKKVTHGVLEWRVFEMITDISQQFLSDPDFVEAISLH